MSELETPVTAVLREMAGNAGTQLRAAQADLSRATAGSADWTAKTERVAELRGLRNGCLLEAERLDPS